MGDKLAVRDAVAAVDQFFADVTVEDMEDPIEVQARIMAEILQAPTLDEAFDVGKTTSLEALAEVPLEVERVKWVRSSYDEGFRYFVVGFGTRLDTGARLTFSGGGGNVVAFLRRAELLEELPVRFKIRLREKKSEAGYQAQLVERV